MLYDILKYYVSYRFGDQKAKDSLERTIQAEAPRHFKNIYWDLFKKYPNMVPVIPKLNVVDTASDNLKYNFDIISKDFKKLTYSDVKDADILDQVTIIQKLGSGAFGKVYEIADNRALKIFSDGVDVKKDIERYEGVIDQVYKGEANLEDMHYFDQGEIAKSGLYYAIMPLVIPLKYAVSNSNNEVIEFYECVEDGLSTIEKSWLTADNALYKGKEFRTIYALTCTIDKLVEKYGLPDLVKIDVEGAETQVLNGMNCKPKQLCFEWSLFTVDQHIKQLEKLRDVNGYTEFALQYITYHLLEPIEYRSLSLAKTLPNWIEQTKDWWEKEEWMKYGERSTADVGMIWVK